MEVRKTPWNMFNVTSRDQEEVYIIQKFELILNINLQLYGMFFLEWYQTFYLNAPSHAEWLCRCRKTTYLAALSMTEDNQRSWTHTEESGNFLLNLLLFSHAY